MKNEKFKLIASFLILNFAFLIGASAQEQPPEPSSPRAVTIPKISKSKLPNGLRIVVVERKNVPLISVGLMIDNGAEVDIKPGLANMTGDLLTKGTKTRSAEAIAEQMDFLGAGVVSSTNWMFTNVNTGATTDKIEQAMTIFADVVMSPTFPQKEIDLYKSQTIDELSVELKQPGQIASYVASRYSFGEHSVQGTPETIKSITRQDLLSNYKKYYKPESSTLVFAGDISLAQAKLAARKYFGSWKKRVSIKEPHEGADDLVVSIKPDQTFERMLVVDLPKSGQAAVIYSQKLIIGRASEEFFAASVANSLLGGGYSSRMNQEIRIKRGLSYGAGSSISWRLSGANFSTRCQTKTVSAAEVAELTIKEIERLINEDAPTSELNPRKNVLNGNFGRSFETNFGVSRQIADLLAFNLPFSELNSFMSGNEEVTPQQVKEFAMNNLRGGDLIIVGDYNDFKDDLKKRFPNQKVEVIKAVDLDLNSDSLRK